MASASSQWKKMQTKRMGCLFFMWLITHFRNLFWKQSPTIADCFCKIFAHGRILAWFLIAKTLGNSAKCHHRRLSIKRTHFQEKKEFAPNSFENRKNALWASSLSPGTWTKGKTEIASGSIPRQGCNFTSNILVNGTGVWEEKRDGSNPVDLKSPEENIPGRSEM